MRTPRHRSRAAPGNRAGRDHDCQQDRPCSHLLGCTCTAGTLLLHVLLTHSCWLQALMTATTSRAPSARPASAARNIQKRRDKPYKTEQSRVVARKRKLDLHVCGHDFSQAIRILTVTVPDDIYQSARRLPVLARGHARPCRSLQRTIETERTACERCQCKLRTRNQRNSLDSPEPRHGALSSTHRSY